ncbi:MAG: imidazole glycerol phosphate synthase subunit HisH [Clostridia bacterium]|nr:imidazole glycerol phosphate synthase subunit HisH [Clostridia bacterium]
MIAIINYGVGNLFSLKSSLAYLGLNTVVTADPAVIEAADRIILPGVGAFADAKAKLEATGLVPLIKAEAESGKPLLGICLGMQMLFDQSLEYGSHEGLGLIHGTVSPITADLQTGLKVPHMGWNALHFTRPDDPLFRYIKEGDHVYYVHSFYAKDCAADTIATSEYGVTITGAVGKGKIYGTQFHPEKSGKVGLAILSAFAEL